MKIYFSNTFKFIKISFEQLYSIFLIKDLKNAYYPYNTEILKHFKTLFFSQDKKN